MANSGIRTRCSKLQTAAGMSSGWPQGGQRPESIAGPSLRHARLAVGSTATLSMFLMETHEERQKP